jgi:hypothetical protein
MTTINLDDVDLAQLQSAAALLPHDRRDNFRRMVGYRVSVEGTPLEQALCEVLSHFGISAPPPTSRRDRNANPNQNPPPQR